MSSKEPGPQGRRQENVRLFPAQNVPAGRRRPAPAEVNIFDGYVHVTLALPEVDDAALRYSLRRRYVLVWGDDSPHKDQFFVLLPKPIDPDHHNIRFQNGVFDLRAKIATPQ